MLSPGLGHGGIDPSEFRFHGQKTETLGMVSRVLVFVLCLALKGTSSWAYAGVPSSRVESGGPALRLAFRTFGLSEGLPNMSVYTFYEDPEGRLWAGTQDGVGVYNGKTWTALNLPPESASQFIRAIAKTPDGSMWFGTEGGGLWRLQGDRWTHLGLGKGFSNNTINCLLVQTQADGRWTLWASTGGGGTGAFDGQAWTFHDQRSGLPSNFVGKLRLMPDDHGVPRIWALTFAGVACFEGNKWRAMDPKEGWPATKVDDIAQILHEDGSRDLWVCQWGQGLLRWDGRQWERFSPAEGGFPSSFPINLQVIRNTRGKPVLWVSTYDRGLAWLSEGVWRNLNTSQGFPSDGIYGFLASKGGRPTLWIGTRGAGLLALNQDGWQALDRDLGLPSDEVHAFAETRDAQGRYALWVGTNQGLAHWEDGNWRTETLKTGLPHDHVGALLVMDKPQGSELWVGTLKGLVKRTKGGWERIHGPKEIQEQRIRCLLAAPFEEGRTRLWAGTEQGLICMDQGQVKLLTPKDGLPAAQIFALGRTEDPGQGESIWVGTRGFGIGRWNQGRWTRYGEAEGLLNQSVFCFREVQSRDGRRWLWAGTFGGGAARLSLDGLPNARWESLTVQNLPGLLNNVVVRIEADASGRVYLVTQRGVVRLSFEDPTDPARPSNLESFTSGDGLAPVSTNYGASFQDHEGRVWVATVRGAAAFNPSEQEQPPPLANLVVDNVTLGGVPGRLDPSGITLTHWSARVAFEFGLPYFYREEDTTYRSQIVGLEKDPTPWGRENHRELVTLPAGSYRLRLEGRDYLGRQTRPLEFPIRVKPAPWWSPAAFVLYVLALGFSLWGVYTLRTQMLRARNQELALKVQSAVATVAVQNESLVNLNQELAHLNEEKSRMMGVLAHDLRNPLGAVLLYAEELREGLDSVETGKKLGIRMASAVDRVIEMSKRILDVTAIDLGRVKVLPRPLDPSTILESVAIDHAAKASTKGHSILVEAVDHPVAFVADPLLLRQVLDNLVSNALKFMPPGPPQLQVRLRQGPGWIEVEDEGPGFKPQDLERAFGRFERLSAKPTAGEPSTGLGLSIVKSLVEAMGGEIRLWSEPGRGARFHMRFPVTP